MIKKLNQHIAIIEESIDPDESIKPTIIVFLTVAVSLTVCRYFGQFTDFDRFFVKGTDWKLSLNDKVFYGKLWWAFIVFIAYVVIPLIVVKVFKLSKIKDLGLSGKGFFKHLPWYLLMILPMLIIIWFVSKDNSFQQQYPFFKHEYWGHTGRFVCWELVYAFQFFCVEFFFRGFLLQIPKRKIGVIAVFVMIIPYCMIHYQKPLLETTGAIFGGTILGFMAIRTNSIYGGVIIHIFVAIAMDLASLYRSGVI